MFRGRKRHHEVNSRGIIDEVCRTLSQSLCRANRLAFDIYSIHVYPLEEFSPASNVYFYSAIGFIFVPCESK